MSIESRPEAQNGFKIKGCPVADKLGSCKCCGGGWPGTLATSEQLTRAALNGRLKPDKLGCGLIQDSARHALRELERSKDGPLT